MRQGNIDSPILTTDGEPVDLQNTMSNRSLRGIKQKAMPFLPYNHRPQSEARPTPSSGLVRHSDMHSMGIKAFESWYFRKVSVLHVHDFCCAKAVGT